MNRETFWDGVLILFAAGQREGLDDVRHSVHYRLSPGGDGIEAALPVKADVVHVHERLEMELQVPLLQVQFLAQLGQAAFLPGQVGMTWTRLAFDQGASSLSAASGDRARFPEYVPMGSRLEPSGSFWFTIVSQSWR